MDKVSKFIMKCLASAASLHDSQALDYLLDESDQGQSIYANSAYVGQCNILAKWDMIDEICEKGIQEPPVDRRTEGFNKKKTLYNLLISPPRLSENSKTRLFYSYPYPSRFANTRFSEGNKIVFGQSPPQNPIREM